MTDGTLVVGAYQAAGTPGDVEANLSEMLAAMDRAAADGIELLVFPEGFLTGYHLPDITTASVPPTAGALGRIARHAGATGVAVIFGVLEADGAALFNTAVAVSDSGAMLARYRKRALFGGWEKGAFTPGTLPVLFEYRGFRIGILICYDLEFPELARETAVAGADLIVVPTSLMVPYDEVADHLVPTRALENQVFVVYANRTGAEHGLSYVGKSSICDPVGHPLAKAGPSGSALISASLNPSAIADARALHSYHRDLKGLSL
jgi:predicted amidohydrolase